MAAAKLEKGRGFLVVGFGAKRRRKVALLAVLRCSRGLTAEAGTPGSWSSMGELDSLLLEAELLLASEHTES